MERLLYFLNLSWVGSLIGITTFLVGIIYAYWLYRKSLLMAIPSITLDSFRIAHGLSGSDLDIKYTYRGREVPRVTKTMVRFWNSGNQCLDGSTLVSRDQFRIELAPDEEFLYVSVTNSTRKANNIVIEINPELLNQALIKFDYLDHNDGAVFKCLHTGRAQMLGNTPNIKGAFKGIPTGANSKVLSIYQSTAITLGPIFSEKIRSYVIFIGVCISLVLTMKNYVDLNVVLTWFFGETVTIDSSGFFSFLINNGNIFAGIILVIILASFGMRTPYPASLNSDEYGA